MSDLTEERAEKAQGEEPVTDPKYPDIEVQLTGQDGNAFVIMGRVTNAMRRAGLDKAVCDAYCAEAMLADYDALLRTTMRWVTVK